MLNHNNLNAFHNRSWSVDKASGMSAAHSCHTKTINSLTSALLAKGVPSKIIIWLNSLTCRSVNTLQTVCQCAKCFMKHGGLCDSSPLALASFTRSKTQQREHGDSSFQYSAWEKFSRNLWGNDTKQVLNSISQFLWCFGHILSIPSTAPHSELWMCRLLSENQWKQMACVSQESQLWCHVIRHSTALNGTRIMTTTSLSFFHI